MASSTKLNLNCRYHLEIPKLTLLQTLELQKKSLERLTPAKRILGTPRSGGAGLRAAALAVHRARPVGGGDVDGAAVKSSISLDSFQFLISYT